MFNKEKWKFLVGADFKCSHKCCDIMKKKPSRTYSKETGRKEIVGTLASDSLTRKTAWLKTGCNAFEAEVPKSQPLSFWTEQDILHYIKMFNIPYCSVYGDIVDVNGDLKTMGCDRTGCIFCMFGCHLEKEPNRFQRLKQTHPRQYQYCIGGGEMVDGKWQPSKEGLGLGKVLDYIGVKYD
jgi:3'-phosphoadenosine 5'-phosphosulfate sulfotransferase (PAPS reductase)/FAD synthetase